jgi:hypothetical protein
MALRLSGCAHTSTRNEPTWIVLIGTASHAARIDGVGTEAVEHGLILYSRALPGTLGGWQPGRRRQSPPRWPGRVAAVQRRDVRAASCW